jgi:tetratricopeptide (TPR) repeat protein
MKNKHWMIVLLFVALATAWPGIILAEGGEEDELSGFALFEKLRAMKLEAQSAMVKEDYAEAAKIYRRMARYEKNRARSAAYLLRGADCLMQAKKGHRALEEYTNLLENYPLYVPYEHVVEQLRQLAEWFIVGDGTFLGIRDKDTGIQIYELIIREAPAVQVTLKDRLRLAELLEGSGRGEEAVVVYQAILRQEPNNWDVHTKLALLFLKLSKNGDGDGSKLRAAVREANLVLESNPNTPMAKELKKLCRDAESEEAARILKNGQFYLLPAHKRPTAARRYMHDVIMKYPDSDAAKEARHLLKTNPELRALEEQNAKIDIVPSKTPSVKPQPVPSVKPQPALTVKLQPTPSNISKPVVEPKKDPKVVERENAKKEAERLKQEKELKARQAELEAEKAKLIKKQEKERQEAEKRAEKKRKAEEAERQKAMEKAAKIKAEREKEEARQREKEEKARQKRLEEERKERQKQEQKRQENFRREAEKSAKERVKKEEEERTRIEKARQKAEGQLLETEGQAKPGENVQLVVQDKKKQEESRREAEEEMKRIRERNARMLKNDPKLLEEEQKRLKELMEKNRRR